MFGLSGLPPIETAGKLYGQENLIRDHGSRPIGGIALWIEFGQYSHIEMTEYGVAIPRTMHAAPFIVK